MAPPSTEPFQAYHQHTADLSYIIVLTFTLKANTNTTIIQGRASLVPLSPYENKQISDREKIAKSKLKPYFENVKVYLKNKLKGFWGAGEQ